MYINKTFVAQSGLISVVMCFLNGSEWIAEAIDSVINQNYPHWELILVDDGSTDGATEIAQQYVSKYPSQLQFVEHAGHLNRGLTISRNAGIARAKGDWIAFLDADDCWFPGKLAADLRLFTLNPTASMICQASTFWYSWQDESRADVYTPVGVEADRLYPPFFLTGALYPLGSGAPPCPSGIIIQTEVLKKHGGFEEEFHGIYGLYEDQAFLAKIYLHEPVFVSGRANNLYRKHAGSMTDKLSDEDLYREVRLFFLRWFESYLDRQKDIPDRIKTKVISAQTALENPSSSLSQE